MLGVTEVQLFVPDRSLEQRMDALRQANAVRSYRAELKAQIRAGERLAADVVAAPESELASMKVWDLLVAAPKTGRVKANKWLRQAHVSPSKTLGGLSERQRAELVALLGGVPRPRPVFVRQP